MLSLREGGIFEEEARVTTLASIISETDKGLDEVRDLLRVATQLGLGEPAARVQIALAALKSAIAERIDVIWPLNAAPQTVTLTPAQAKHAPPPRPALRSVDWQLPALALY